MSGWTRADAEEKFSQRAVSLDLPTIGAAVLCAVAGVVLALPPAIFAGLLVGVL